MKLFLFVVVTLNDDVWSCKSFLDIIYYYDKALYFGKKNIVQHPIR